MWNILRTLLPNSKKNLPTEIPKLILNEVEVFQNDKICDYFNKQFATIGINLANQIKTDLNKFKSFLSNRVSSSAAFDSPTATEIYNTIFSLKTKLNPELDILLYFLKIAANILSPFLALLFHHVFSSGIFLESLKTVKVLPVFKVGSKTDINNYRLISILPCLSKLIEKLILKCITSCLDKHEVIQPHQFGFHKKIPLFMHLLTLCLVAMMQQMKKSFKPHYDWYTKSFWYSMS